MRLQRVARRKMGVTTRNKGVEKRELFVPTHEKRATDRQMSVRVRPEYFLNRRNTAFSGLNQHRTHTLVDEIPVHILTRLPCADASGQHEQVLPIAELLVQLHGPDDPVE